MLCQGFGRIRCDGCAETRIVAFNCKGRAFCPSCLGRKMAQTAAYLMKDVLPMVPMRQWVLTFPHVWRKRLGFANAIKRILKCL
jgi:Transposase zinc-binding domain